MGQTQNGRLYLRYEEQLCNNNVAKGDKTLADKMISPFCCNKLPLHGFLSLAKAEKNKHENSILLFFFSFLHHALLKNHGAQINVLHVKSAFPGLELHVSHEWQAMTQKTCITIVSCQPFCAYMYLILSRSSHSNVSKEVN